MLTYTCKTAIKAVIFLATRAPSGEKAGIREIAEALDASEHTVGKLLQTLARQGIINSTKGPSGGFYISTVQQQQQLIDIVEAIDGKDSFMGCGLGLSRCSATHPCPIHHDYKKARDIIAGIFRSKRVIDLCKPVSNGVAYLLG